MARLAFPVRGVPGSYRHRWEREDLTDEVRLRAEAEAVERRWARAAVLGMLWREEVAAECRLVAQEPACQQCQWS